jgi:hypothetical protein
VHVHKDPPLLGTFPAALEGSLDVFIYVFALQGKADSAEDCLGVLDRRIVVPKKASIRRDSQPALLQHYEAVKCRNSIGVEVN